MFFSWTENDFFKYKLDLPIISSSLEDDKNYVFIESNINNFPLSPQLLTKSQKEQLKFTNNNNNCDDNMIIDDSKIYKERGEQIKNIFKNNNKIQK